MSVTVVILSALEFQKTVNKGGEGGRISVTKTGMNSEIIQSSFRITCWLELAEGGVITLWSTKGLAGAELGRCVARQ